MSGVPASKGLLAAVVTIESKCSLVTKIFAFFFSDQETVVEIHDITLGACRSGQRR